MHSTQCPKIQTRRQTPKPIQRTRKIPLIQLIQRCPVLTHVLL